MKRIILSLVVPTFLGSCSEPPAPSFSLQDRQLVDSLYQMEYEQIVDTLDAQCEIMQTTQLDQIVDSLLKERLVEVMQQRQRYQQNEQ
ncbi:MAG: hypothetical protein AAGI23_17440 [Bacteroidota bacterium]